MLNADADGSVCSVVLLFVVRLSAVESIDVVAIKAESVLSLLLLSSLCYRSKIWRPFPTFYLRDTWHFVKELAKLVSWHLTSTITEYMTSLLRLEVEVQLPALALPQMILFFHATVTVQMKLKILPTTQNAGDTTTPLPRRKRSSFRRVDDPILRLKSQQDSILGSSFFTCMALWRSLTIAMLF
jgi:hypothetical protein